MILVTGYLGMVRRLVRTNLYQGVRPDRTSAQASRPNATVEANVRRWFHRTHLASSNRSRTPWRSVMWSMSPAALISLLRGTLTPMVMTKTTRYKTNAAAIHASSGR